MVSLASGSLAQTTDAELKSLQNERAKLEEELKILQARKQIEEANAPANAALQRLLDQNAMLSEQVTRATNMQSLADASVPKITGGLEGKTTFSGDTPAEAVHLAYQSFSGIATAMAKDIKCDANGRIMIFSAAEISALESLSAFRLQSSVLNDHLVQALKADSEVDREEVKPKTKPPEFGKASVPMAVALAGPLIQSLIDITKLFRVDREISAKDITPDDKALIAILAGKLSGGCAILYPELVPASLLEELKIGGSSSDGPASLTGWLKSVAENTAKIRLRLIERTKEKVAEDQSIEAATEALEEMGKVAKTIASLEEKVKGLKDKLDKAGAKDKPGVEKELKAAEAELKKAQAAFAKLDETPWKSNLNKSKQLRAQLVELLKILTAALEAGDAYRDALLKEAGSGLTLLSRLIRSSRLEEQLKAPGGKSSMLHVSVQKLTATTLKKTNAFRGARYTYSGGAIATFIQFGLWDENKPVNGAIAGSGTYTGYSGQYKPGSETPSGKMPSGKL
ncbi:MAG: hypothetical protein C0504_00310 [Candidatus Solibacter sp.]|nr:hypothetical protein [Candidatus Solibacter sp.]